MASKTANDVHMLFSLAGEGSRCRLCVEIDFKYLLADLLTLNVKVTSN
ncbi:hypothetical protein [Neptunitalea chrysea]|nr:hypothetical protein [Neptunitalea chrysea]